MPEDISSRVIKVIADTQHIAADSISIDSTFEQLHIDSLDGINIVFALENEFDISIPDEGVQQIRTVRDMVEGIRKLLDAKGPQSAPAIS